jgi:16S rRNA G527 N7-methylase RsmG
VPAVAALRWLDVELPLNVVEIGAGNAALGLTLAALAPQWRVTLVDRRERAVAFMEIAALQMGLHNVVPLRADAREPGSGAGRVDAALFRAVGTPAEDLDMAAAWLKPGGSCLIWTSADLPQPPDDAVWCHLGTVAVLDGRMAVLAYAKT